MFRLALCFKHASVLDSYLYTRIFVFSTLLCIREGGDVQKVPSVVAPSVGKQSPCLLDDRNVTLKVARVSSPSLYFVSLVCFGGGIVFLLAQCNNLETYMVFVFSSSLMLLFLAVSRLAALVFGAFGLKT